MVNRSIEYNKRKNVNLTEISENVTEISEIAEREL